MLEGHFSNLIYFLIQNLKYLKVSHNITQGLKSGKKSVTYYLNGTIMFLLVDDHLECDEDDDEIGKHFDSTASKCEEEEIDLSSEKSISPFNEDVKNSDQDFADSCSEVHFLKIFFTISLIPFLGARHQININKMVMP